MSQAPSIRGFQFDTSSTASANSSVNLFRGDVNLSLPLLTMPARTSDQGLDVSLTLLCQSNVRRAALTWNRDEPTGVVGLGWTFPLTYIELADSGSPAPTARSYQYVVNGSPSPLVREPVTPRLFTLATDVLEQLVAGKTVPAAAVSAFGSYGISLSTSADVASHGSEGWVIDDAGLQQTFLVLAGGEVRAGGESYQLQSYDFSRILYYPRYERWVIVDASGAISSFGGVAAPTPTRGYRTSQGNSVEWMVTWTAADGVPLWSGSSAVSTHQCQIARAWHLRSQSDVWGDTVLYAYNEWARGSDERIPGVEQLVGPDGLPYTKACYLTSVTDVFGRKAVMRYGDKLWDGSSEEGPREYADPHKDVPDDTPNAWQDRYETLYLDTIAVQDVDATPLFSIVLAYAPRDAGDASAVANVTSFTGSLYGDTFKRYLTAVSYVTAQGDGRPPVKLSYELGPVPDGVDPVEVNLGAIRTMTSPEGATSSWTYKRQELAVCDRTTHLVPPAELPVGATPRVWFGSTYAVVTWYHAAAHQLTLQINTWDGRWVAWQLDADSAILFDDAAGLDPDTLSVVAEDDFFALSFTTGGTQELYLFSADPARPGTWIPAKIGDVTTGRNTPTTTHDTGAGAVRVVSGTSFFLVGKLGTTQLERYTWRWTTRSWTLDQPPVGTLSALTASGEVYLTVDTTGQVSLTRLGARLVWQTGGTLTILALANVAAANLALAAGSAMVALTHLVSSQPKVQIVYDLYPLQWDAAYRFTAGSATSTRFTDKQDPSSSVISGWQASVVDDTTIACSAHVLRFDGTAWHTSSLLQLSSVQSGEQQRYAYGTDWILQVLVSGTSVQRTLVPFDANALSPAWSTQKTSPSAPKDAPAAFASTANYPWAGISDTLSLGTKLYFRGTNTDWGTVIAGGYTDLQALVDRQLGASRYIVNTESVRNQGPAFVAFDVYDTAAGNAVSTVIAVSGNGQVDPTLLHLDGQRMGTPTDPDAATSGAGVSGPEALVTFPSTVSSLTNASELWLYRYAGDDLDGKIAHYAVQTFRLDNGYTSEAASTCFVADPDEATCDSSGTVMKYYRNTVYPGAASPQEAVYGSVVKTWVNGYAGLTGEDWATMLDGLQLGAQMYAADGTLEAEVSFDWTAYTARANDPSDASAGSSVLYGGFVARTGITHSVRGVTGRRAMRYVREGFDAPASTQPVSSTETKVGSTGAVETTVVDTSYQFELPADIFRALNMLTTKAGTSRSWACGDTDPVTTRASAMPWIAWPTSRGDGVLAPAAAARFDWVEGDTPFPFDSWVPGDVPQGWHLRARTTGRNTVGLVTETEDACGVATSTLFAGADTFPVVKAVNASLLGGELAYLGFEPYESGGGWTFRGELVDDDAWLGTRSLQLPADGSGTASATITARSAGRYVLGYAVKTVGSGASWTLSGACAPMTIDIPDTAGEWRWFTAGFDLAAGASVTATATNTSGQICNLDALTLAPLVCQLSGQVFAPTARVVTGTFSLNGYGSRTTYDRFLQPTLTTGPDAAPSSLTLAGLSRAGATDDTFDPDNPDTNLSLTAAGGAAETFRDGGGWKARWQASDDWIVEDGSLRHTTATDETLAWKGWEAPPATAALCVEIHPDAALSGPVGVTFDGNTIGWDPVTSAWTWTGPTGTVASPLLAPPEMARTWLCVFGDGVLFFFADGQLVFSEAWSGGVPGALAIATGPNPLTLRNLAILDTPRLTLTYTDAAGNTRQEHALCGADALITQTVTDGLGRTIATGRPAPWSFAAAMPLLAWSPTLVDVSAFLAATAESGEMTGDLADYYAGQLDDGVPRSDDEGYPYTGTRYDATSKKRKTEEGLPGLPYAIGGGASTRYRYTGSAQHGGTPKASYVETLETSPVGNTSVTLRDASRHTVGSAVADSEGAVVRKSWTTETWAKGSHTVEDLLPNLFSSSPQSGSPGYTNTQQQGALGRTARVTNPDSGVIDCIYDPAGRARFVQPPLDPGECFFLYFRYDGLGRTLEQGVVQQAWDAELLASKAGDPSWPDAGVPHRVSRITAWDGDGSDPALIGRIATVTTTTTSPDATCSVTETLTWDVYGNIASVAQVGEASGTIGYDYDAFGEVIRLTMPDGCPVPEVCYTYDDQGRVVAIGSSPGAKDFAAYVWNADGTPRCVTMGAVAVTCQYASPGWPLLLTATVAGSTVWSLGSAYNADGTLQSQSETVGDDPPISTTFTWDAQQRLCSASVAGASDGNEAVTSYDANGNVWAVTRDGVDCAFPCVSGSDRIAEVQVGDADVVVPVYAATGRLTTLGTTSVAYDNGLGRASAIQAGSTLVTFGYGSQGQRVNKSVTGGYRRTYFCGNGLSPLAMQTDGVWTVYVYGPTGIVAIVQDQRYVPLLDPSGTARLVLDASGDAVARYRFYPFGGPLEATGSRPEILPHRYMAQEWDPEVGVYNFKARLYDPVLGRFHSPDSQQQYPSAYVFVGNNPVTNTDPTGDFNWAMAVGAASVVALTVLTVATAGAAAWLDAADAAMVAGEAMTEAAEFSLEELGEEELVDLIAEPAERQSLLGGDRPVSYGATSKAETPPAAGGGGKSKFAFGKRAKHFTKRATVSMGLNSLVSGVSASQKPDASAGSVAGAALFGGVRGFLTGGIGSVFDMPRTRALLTFLPEGTSGTVLRAVGATVGRAAVGATVAVPMQMLADRGCDPKSLALAAVKGSATAAAGPWIAAGIGKVAKGYADIDPSTFGYRRFGGRF